MQGFKGTLYFLGSGEIYIGEKVEGQREEAAAQGHTAGESGRQDSQLAGSAATAPTSSVTQSFSSRRNKYKLEVSGSRHLNLQVLTNAPGEQHYIFFVFF